ncbi:hypothetical protein BMS3Bbin07_01117 [bacterium BMS3Bbin07]|nr:hypothetical protein BMS3Bbin07_01117 [bacterium BMS3Bbin07]
MNPESRKLFLETRARIIERARKESKSRSKSLKDMLFACTPGNIKYYNLKKIEDTKVVNEDQSKEDSDGK